jgi:hypothetical protein
MGGKEMEIRGKRGEGEGAPKERYLPGEPDKDL